MSNTDTTYRQHYTSIEHQGGHVPELHVEVPRELRYVFSWFSELSGSRGENGILFSDIAAWGDLTGRSPLIFEVQLLKKIDRIYLEVFRA